MKEMLKKNTRFHSVAILVVLLFVVGMSVAQGQSDNSKNNKDNNNLIIAVAGNVPLKVLAEQGEVLQGDILAVEEVASMRLRSGVVQSAYINALFPDQTEEIFHQLSLKNVFNANDTVNIAGQTFLLSNTPREQFISQVLDATVELDGRETEVSEVTQLVKEVSFGNQIHWVGYWNQDSNEFLRTKALYYEVLLREGENAKKVSEKLVERLSHANFSAEGVGAKLVETTQHDAWYAPILNWLHIKNPADSQRIAIFVPNPSSLDEQSLIQRSVSIDGLLKRYVSDIDSYYYRYNGYAYGTIQPFEIVINLVPDRQLQTSQDIAAGIQAELQKLFGDDATATVIE